MLLVCFMCLVFLSPGDDLYIGDTMTLYNTKSNIARGNTLVMKDAPVDKGSKTTGNDYRVAGADADMGIFPMEVQADDTVIITSPYLIRYSNTPHCGIDLCVSGKPESAIVASRDGIVTKVYAGCGKSYGASMGSCSGPHSESFGYSTCSGYGNHVVITHSDGTKTLYAHMGPGSVDIAPGSIVQAGEKIGIEGTSGNSTGNHLHYAVYGAKHTASIANFPDVYKSALTSDQLAKETLISVGGIESAYSGNSLDPNTEFANVYLSTRLLYETITRDAETSEPYAVHEWGNKTRGKNSYISILCAGGENSLENDYTNTNLWRPLG